MDAVLELNSQCTVFIRSVLFWNRNSYSYSNWGDKVFQRFSQNERKGLNTTPKQDTVAAQYRRSHLHLRGSQHGRLGGNIGHFISIIAIQVSTRAALVLTTRSFAIPCHGSTNHTEHHQISAPLRFRRSRYFAA